MKLILIAIYDTAAAAYQPPATVRALGEAVRSFQNVINDPNAGLVNKYPEQYNLYQLGEFDDQTGELTQAEKPKLIAKGDQLTTKITIK